MYMMFGYSRQDNLVITRRKERSAVLFSLLMLLTSYSAIEFATWEAMGSTDADGDGLPYGLEYYINTCLLYTSPSPRDRTRSRMPSSA